MSDGDMFKSVLASLHEATLDDAHWPATSALIDQACGAKGNGIAFGYAGQVVDERIIFIDLSYRGERHDELVREYLRDYYALDERIPRLLRLPDGQIAHTPDLYTREEKKTSIAYNEVLLRGQFQHGLSCRLDGPRGSCIVWNIGDPVDGGSWSSAQVEFARSLLPHLRHYLCARKMLADAGALSVSFATMLEEIQCGIVQLDWRGRIKAANDLALKVLQQGNALVDKGGMLSALSATDDVALQGLLARALPGIGKQAAGGSMRVALCQGMPGLVVQVTPVGVGATDVRPWEVAALVLIVEQERATSIDPNVLEATFGLTPTESLVAALLAQGRTASDIASEWKRSERTIRWHITQIFDKLGITRQAELVRRVLLLSGHRDNRQRALKGLQESTGTVRRGYELPT